jgi:hypothetical protein
MAEVPGYTDESNTVAIPLLSPCGWELWDRVSVDLDPP